MQYNSGGSGVFGLANSAGATAGYIPAQIAKMHLGPGITLMNEPAQQHLDLLQRQVFRKSMNKQRYYRIGRKSSLPSKFRLNKAYKKKPRKVVAKRKYVKRKPYKVRKKTYKKK